MFKYLSQFLAVSALFGFVLHSVAQYDAVKQYDLSNAAVVVLSIAITLLLYVVLWWLNQKLHS